MWPDLARVCVVGIVGWGIYALNGILNPSAKLKQIVGVIIIVVTILFLIVPTIDIIQLAFSSANTK